MSGPFLYAATRPVGLIDLLDDDVDARITFTRASTRTYFDSAGVMQTAAVDAWPLEFDPATLKRRGRSLWPQRTNICLRSQEFDNAFWTKGNVTITANATTAPDGTMTADLAQTTTTAATTLVSANITATSAAHTYSIFTKKGNVSTRDFLLRNVTTATNFDIATFNYDTGAVSGTGWTAEPVGNGWFRLTYARLTGVTAGNFLTLYAGARGTSDTAGNNWYVWGADLENGPYATPYIPTTSATVTRSADVASVNTLSSIGFNAAEGTMIAEAILARASDATANQYLFNFNNNTTANRIMMYRPAANTIVSQAIDASVAQAILTSAGTYPGTTFVRAALAYKANDFAMSVLGASVQTDTSGTVPSVDRLHIGHQVSGSQLGGWVRWLRYFPRRLPNANLVKAA